MDGRFHSEINKNTKGEKKKLIWGEKVPLATLKILGEAFGEKCSADLEKITLNIKEATSPTNVRNIDEFARYLVFGDNGPELLEDKKLKIQVEEDIKWFMNYKLIIQNLSTKEYALSETGIIILGNYAINNS